MDREDTPQVEKEEEVAGSKLLIDGPPIVAQQGGEMKEASQAGALQSTEVATEIAFFVVGKTGAGKSSLINSLVGKKVAKVSKGPDPVEHKPIEPHEGEVGKHKIKVLLYDTKGLGTRDDIKLVKRFKQEMVRGGNQFFILICQKITDRLDDSVIHFAELLAGELKDNYSLLIRCIFVLTYANQYFDGDQYEDESDNEELNDSAEKRKTEMKMIMATWSEKFKKHLQEYEVPEDIIMKMHVCVAGNRKTRALPVTEDWIEELLDTCRSTGKEFQDFAGMTKSTKEYGALVGSMVDKTFASVAGFRTTIGRAIGDHIGWKYGIHMTNKMIKKRIEEKKGEE